MVELKIKRKKLSYVQNLNFDLQRILPGNQRDGRVISMAQINN